MDTITGMLVTEDGLVDIGAPNEVDVVELTCSWQVPITRPMSIHGLIAFFPPPMTAVMGRPATYNPLAVARLIAGDTLRVNYKVSIK